MMQTLYVVLYVALKNSLTISNLPGFSYNKSSYDQSNLFDLCKPIRVMITNNWMMLLGRELLKPIYTARLCRMRQAYDRPTT